MSNDFEHRADLIEEMDRPDSPEVLLRRTLAQFEPVNRIFSRYRTLCERIFLAGMQREPERSYRLVDLGAGGGDIDRWLIDRSRERKLRLTIAAVEHDPRVIAYMRRANAEYPEIETVESDVLNARTLAGADYIFANHLLHHLPGDRCIALLRAVDKAAPMAYLITDIVRSRAAYWCYSLLASVLFRGSFVAGDGRISIRRSFTVAEARRLVSEAGIADACSVRCIFPGRLVIEGGRRLNN